MIFSRNSQNNVSASISAILSLFGDSEEIDIIDNNVLETYLQTLANSVSSDLKAANKVVKEKLERVFCFNNYWLLDSHCET